MTLIIGNNGFDRIGRCTLAPDPEPKVSIDFNHPPSSSIVAPDQTKVVDGRTVRVLALYDNEWGFSRRMADRAATMGRLLHQGYPWAVAPGP